MARNVMQKMFLNVIEESKKFGELRDLLVIGDPTKLPKIGVGKKQYVLGLVDEKPMLLSMDGNRELLDPAIVAGQVHGMSWDLEPVEAAT